VQINKVPEGRLNGARPSGRFIVRGRQMVELFGGRMNNER
jgi:hypothetical protein